jgi:hypothetical protein
MSKCRKLEECVKRKTSLSSCPEKSQQFMKNAKNPKKWSSNLLPKSLMIKNLVLTLEIRILRADSVLITACKEIST